MKSTPFPFNPILIVDDEDTVLTDYKFSLGENGITNLLLCRDSREVMKILSEKAISLIMLDLFMPHISGCELLEQINKEYPDIPVIIITGATEVATAVACMKEGAFDYFVKPVSIRKLLASIHHAAEIAALKKEVDTLSRELLIRDISHPEAFEEIITINEQMKAIFKYTEAVAASPKPVLITGESGVGKELIARACHLLSGRKGKFVSVNSAGLDDTFFSDTLFGHVKGAYTGAEQDRRGLVEEAADGTLFLDEIGDMPEISQVKLLRLIQEGEYLALGSNKIHRCYARIISATNSSLEEKQEKGSFRKDLYYRIRTHHIHLPPLRERMEDIPVLLDHFIESACAEVNKPKPRIPASLEQLLGAYYFPGNIRELQVMVYDAMSQYRTDKDFNVYFEKYLDKHADHLQKSIENRYQKKMILPYTGEFPTLKETEKVLIDLALQQAKGEKRMAAKLLGIARATLFRKLKKME